VEYIRDSLVSVMALLRAGRPAFDSWLDREFFFSHPPLDML